MRKAVTVVLILALFTLSYATNLTTNPSFETPEDTDGPWPEVYGDWNGDYSSIVGARSELSPLQGTNMLQFLGTGYEHYAQSLGTSQISQLIDLSGYSDLISSGNASIQASAYFNRLPGDTYTDTLMGFHLYSYVGTASDYETLKRTGNYTAHDYVAIETDALTNTWEIAELQLSLPSNVDFIAIELCAWENVYNDWSNTEFDGHYADMVSVTMVPEPATILLFATASLLIRKRK